MACSLFVQAQDCIEMPVMSASTADSTGSFVHVNHPSSKISYAKNSSVKKKKVCLIWKPTKKVPHIIILFLLFLLRIQKVVCQRIRDTDLRRDGKAVYMTITENRVLRHQEAEANHGILLNTKSIANLWTTGQALL